MAKFTKNIERMIADLRRDEKIQAMHRDNIDHAVARRARRAELCRLFLAAYCYRKNVGAVISYDDREAKKEAIREGINQKFNGSALIAEMAYVLGNMEKAIKGEEVKISDEFTDLIDECRQEEEAKQEEEDRIRRKEHEESIKNHSRLMEHAKNVLGYDIRENKRPTLSLNRTVSKQENRIITVGNKKAYQVGKGDYKHRNGRIIEN